MQQRPRNTSPAAESPSGFDARWEGVFEAYTASYVHKNLWRLRRTCDEDDAMQEARIVFLRCARQYKDAVDNAAWFMSLYKRSLAARFADLATKDGHVRSVGELMCDVIDDTEGGVMLEPIGETANEGELAVLVAQAPSEVREVLALLLNAPIEIMELAAGAWRSKGRKSAFGNAMLNMLLGRPAEHPTLERVRDYFDIGPV